MNTLLTRYAGWAACISGLASIVGFVALTLFFSLEAPQLATDPQAARLWGPLSDIASPLTMIPLILFMLALHQIERERAPILSRVAAIIGVIGALAVALLQVLLVAKVLPFEQEVGPVVVAMGVVGVWLILANHLGRIQQIMPSRLAWLGIVVGVSQVLYPVIFPLIGGAGFYESIGSNYLLLTLTGIIFFASYVGFPVWAIGLGRVWSSKRKPANAGVAYAG